MRNENLRNFAQDVGASEKRHWQKEQEAGKTLQHWWEQDVKHFNEILPTIGDYFW